MPKIYSFILGCFLSSGAFAADGSFVQRFRTQEEIVQASCRTATLSQSTSQRCGAYGLAPQDFIHVSQKLGDTVSRYINTAYERGYYARMDKNDFFHGHLIAKGPQTTYQSPEEYYSDVTSILFHSREYVRGGWESIPDSEDPRNPSKPRVPRSFFGYLNDFAAEELIPAIDLVASHVRLMRAYASAGTVYTENITDSLPHITNHSYHPEDPMFIKTCEGEGCEPCEINKQLYILEDSKGRWVTPDQVRIEMFLVCKYSLKRPKFDPKKN